MALEKQHRIERSGAGLLVVDIQERLLPGIYGKVSFYDEPLLVDRQDSSLRRCVP